MLSWLTADEWIAVAGTIIAISALLFSIVSNKQKREVEELNRKLESRLKTITIDDIRNFAEDAVSFLGSWRPDVIYCPDLRGGFMGYFVMKEMRVEIPILTGYIYPRDRPTPNCNIDNYYEELSTPKYHVLIEKYIHKFTGKNVLIVDEIAITGEAVHFITQLIKTHSPSSTIKSCVAVVCTAAIQSGRKPCFAWRTVEHYDITFPWGRWA